MRLYFSGWVAVCLLVTCTLVTPLNSIAHELRPAYLQIEQLDAQRFGITWRVPARGQLRLSLDVQMDRSASPLYPPSGGFNMGVYTERWQIHHPNALSGLSIAIKGLEHTLTDALVRISWLDGREQIQRLMPDRPGFTVKAQEAHSQIALTYFYFGLEHILLGIDHLLFVLVLMLLCGGWRQLLLTITAFTLAHSITLAGAALGHISLPQAPVEAVITLSIVFTASEILAKQRGKRSMAIRFPWLVAFGFGLLHGLGFAGAVTDIGFPQGAVPLALLTFNLGVELGQLVFITIMASLFWALRCTHWRVQQWRFRGRQSIKENWNRDKAAVWITAPLTYTIGGIAFCWCLENILSLFP
ncbi:HupE/UreJ family protein [Microbulbifer epialgicus]|uniref:HupE/UreJ family protein n=1 Tax=Microbulbifer epialgicus TaxID=393907 RepID=A0ABV4NZU7_9GAMM